MIDTVLTFVQGALNDHLRRAFSSREDLALLSPLIDQDGSVPPEIENKVVLSLIRIEREGTAAQGAFMSRSGERNTARITPALPINLFVLVSGINKNYRDALALLSAAIGFFQGQPAFTAQQSPGFPAGVQKLTAEVFNMEFQDMSHLWGALGAKYKPSIIYKIRMITIQEAWTTEQRPAVVGGEAKIQR